MFLLSQFFQTGQGLSPLEAGLRTLPWTAMPMFVAPVAGLLSDRIGARPLMAAGLALQAVAIGVAGRRVVARRRLHVAHRAVGDGGHRHGAGLRPVGERDARRPCARGGGPGLGRDERDPRARRRPRRRGARLACSAAHGSYASPQAFTDGVVAALPVAVVVLAIGAVAALFVPGVGAARERSGAVVAEPVEA